MDTETTGYQSRNYEDQISNQELESQSEKPTWVSEKCFQYEEMQGGLH